MRILIHLCLNTLPILHTNRFTYWLFIFFCYQTDSFWCFKIIYYIFSSFEFSINSTRWSESLFFALFFICFWYGYCCCSWICIRIFHPFTTRNLYAHKELLKENYAQAFSLFLHLSWMKKNIELNIQFMESFQYVSLWWI